MLRSLEAAGKLSLPPPLTVAHRRGDAKPPARISHDTTPIECGIRELAPLREKIAGDGAPLAKFKSLLSYTITSGTVCLSAIT